MNSNLEVAADKSEKPTMTYCTLSLGSSEFAIEVSSVQEVISVPEHFSQVPLAPEFLLGLINLRGSILPVVDLRELLKISQTEVPESQKIAIVDFQGMLIGLVFDKTGDVFRDENSERCDFEILNKEEIVSGVFKKDEGKRIVQILSIERLFHLKGIPKSSGGSKIDRNDGKKKRGMREQCISFVVGPAKCALPISAIQEINRLDQINESALSSGYCIGTIDLRGITVPVVDFAAFLKYRDVLSSYSNGSESRRLIVMRIGQEHFGLIVDAVESIVSYYPDELISFPMIGQSREQMFLGCIASQTGNEILLLDQKAILTNSEIEEITRGHSKIYRSDSVTSAHTNLRNSKRLTYISFRIKDLFALPINEVSEIINYPNQLMHPPGAQAHIAGVLNLRGELYTIVDIRKLCQLDSSELNEKSINRSDSKVLIYKENETRLGIVVDSIDSILSLMANEKIKLPKTMFNSDANKMAESVSEALELKSNNGEKTTVMVLNIKSIADRIFGHQAA